MPMDSGCHSPLHALPSLLLQIYRLASRREAGEFMPSALDLLRSQLRFDSAVWGCAVTGNGDDIAILRVNTFEKPDNWLENYEKVKHGDLFARHALHLRTGVLAARSREMYSGPEHQEFREYTEQFGHAHILAAFDGSAEGGRYEEWITLYRADDRRPYDEADHTLIGQLVPHLQEALAISQRLALEQHQRNQLNSAGGNAIAHPRGGLYYAEPGFLALLQAEFPQSNRHQLPEQVLSELLQKRRYIGPEIVIDLERQACLLHLAARPAGSVETLTARELQIALAYAEGCTHKEIAARFAVSPNTVRNQTRAIYQKLSVHNVAAMVRELRVMNLV